MVRHAQSTQHVGPTSATLDEAFNAFFGAGLGVAFGSALCAFSVRRGSRLGSALLAGLAAYVLVLTPVFMFSDDVNLREDLSPSSLLFFAFLLLPFAAFALVGASVGRFISLLMRREWPRKRHQH